MRVLMRSRKECEGKGILDFMSCAETGFESLKIGILERLVIFGN